MSTTRNWPNTYYVIFDLPTKIRVHKISSRPTVRGFRVYQQRRLTNGHFISHDNQNDRLDAEKRTVGINASFIPSWHVKTWMTERYKRERLIQKVHQQGMKNEGDALIP